MECKNFFFWFKSNRRYSGAQAHKVKKQSSFNPKNNNQAGNDTCESFPSILENEYLVKPEIAKKILDAREMIRQIFESKKKGGKSIPQLIDKKFQKVPPLSPSKVTGNKADGVG